jgi:hypothetical protein
MGRIKMRGRALLLVVAALLAAGVASVSGGARVRAVTAVPIEMNFACSLKSNGLMRYVSNLNQCTKNEDKITIKPGPITICVNPDGTVRKIPPAQCNKPGVVLTLPPTSGIVYFCAANSNGQLRYVTSPSQCTATEFPVMVTPNAGTIIVKKVTNPSPDPSDTSFSFTAGGGLSPSSFSLKNGQQQTFSNVSPGSGYSVAETVPSGWDLTSSTCSDGSPVSNIDVSPGETVTCTFTDRKRGTIVIKKVTNPSPDPSDTSFSFTAGGGLSPSGFSLKNGQQQTFSNVTPGNGYSAAETVPAGWDLTSATCSDGSPVNNIDVGAGETVTCTFTDSKRGTIIVKKVTDPSPDPSDTSFSFSAGGGLSPSSFSLKNGQQQTFSNVTSGSGYSVSETVPSGWSLTSATCDDGSPVSNIDVGAGETVTCTFTDRKAGSIIVKKVTNPSPDPSDTSFSFTAGGGLSPSSFSLKNGDQQTFSNVAPGSGYNVSESVPAGWDLTSSTCDDGSSVTNIDVSAGETVTCTFTNRKRGTIIVKKVTDPSPDLTNTSFPFTAGGGLSPSSFSLKNGDQQTFSNVVPGSGYSVAETVPTGWNLTSALCDDGSVVSNIDVSAGETVTCTFTDTGDRAPTDIQLTNSSIAENQPSGTDVGTLTTTDPDAGDTHTYSLQNTGCGGGPFPDNSSFQIGGASNDKLQSAASFDFETKSSYTVCVRSTDSGGLSFDKQFTISVTNVNEPPTDISLSNNSIDENKPSGSLVGNLSQVGDPDSGETYTFSVVTSGCSGSFPDSSSFQTSGSQLQSAVSFNFEAKSSYSICVRVNDPGSPNLSFDKQFTISINDVNDPPVDGNESTNAVGNTLLEYGAVPSPSSAAKKVVSGNLLANATDEDQPPQTLSISASDTTSAQGGDVSVSSSGAFSYVPKAGFTGTDTFNYTVSDGNGGTDTSTVTITVASRVWYVKNNAAAGGTGRSTDPFDTLGEADTAANATGDITYVYKGDGTTTGLTGGFSLLASQKLLGEPVNLVVGADTLATGTPANRPSLSGTVALASGSRVEAVDISGSGGAAIAGTNTGGSDVTNVNLSGNGGGVALTGAAAGTFNFTNFTITTSAGTGFLVNSSGAPTINVGSGSTENVSATGGPAVDVRTVNGSSSLAFDAVSSTASAGAGINLDSNGAAPFSASSGSISGAAGNAIDISGGSGNVTYPGTLGDGSGNTADITGRTGGSISLSGNINDTPDAGGGITMSGNTGGSTTFSGSTKTLNTGASAAFSSTGSGQTITFSGGGLNIDTTSGAGFSATGGGTVNVTGLANRIDTTTGTALNVSSTNIGASGLTFEHISAGAGTSAGAGPANGIVLNTTGSSGGLTVTGDGTDTSLGGNSTGGTISNATGADGATAGRAIYLNNTSSVVLRRMTINGTNQNFGIYGSGVNGATVEYSTIGGTEGTSTGADEGSVIFDGLTGTSTFSKVALSGSIEDNFRIRNSSGTSNVTIDSSTFTNAPNDNIIIEPSGTSNVTAHVTNNTFTGAGGDHLQTASTNSSTLNIVFTGNFFSNGLAGSLGGGVTISGGNAGSTENVNFNISNNGSSGTPLVGTVQGGTINVNQGNGAGAWQGQVSNNWIGNPTVALSACQQCSGIRVENHSPSGTMKAIVDSNHVRSWGTGAAINTQVGDTGNVNAAIDLTVTNNVITNPGPLTQHGIVGNFGADASGTNAACFDTRTNNITLGNPPPNSGSDLRIRQRNSSTVKLPGYLGGTTDTTAVATFEKAQNTLNDTGFEVAAAASGSGGGFIGGGACAQPTVPS